MTELLAIYDTIETQIKELICVTKPYNALKNFRMLTDEIIQADVTIENNFSGECTLVSGAEAGRHLAILGSCALALQNPVKTKHYYLANHAFVIRSEDTTNIIRTNSIGSIHLVAQAKVISVDFKNKTGKVETKFLTEEGELIYTIIVSYQILKAELFQKLFRKNFVEEIIRNHENPYTENVKINNLKYNENIFSGDLGIIAPNQCVGHFDHYPALPIAILSSAFAQLAGLHLQHKLNNEFVKFSVKKATLSAARLAFAGEHVFITSSFIREEKGEYVFLIKANNELQNELGEIEITFDIIN